MWHTFLLLFLSVVGMHNRGDASPTPELRVDEIIIEGNLYTHERVILNELTHAGIKVGSVLTQAMLAKATESLNARGIFDPDEPPKAFMWVEAGRIRVIVQVKETRTGIVGTGVGVLGYRETKLQPIEDAYRKLVSYQGLFEVDTVPNLVEATRTFWSPVVSRIIIEGNTYTSDRFIRAELKRSGVFVGGKLSEAAMAKAAVKLQRHDNFDPDETPQVYALNDECMPHAKIVVVKVKETFTGVVCTGEAVFGRRMIKQRPFQEAFNKLTSSQNLLGCGSDIQTTRPN